MRAPASFQVSIRRFGIWRAAMLATASFVALSLLAWVVTQPSTVSAWKLGLFWILVIVAFGFVASLLSSRPVSLRWDGQGWHLGPADSTGQEPLPGELGVAIDLGPWMLLRFRHAPRSRRPHWTWIPVQRPGLEPQWHALRCAVYCARPAPGTVAEAGPQSPLHELP